MESFTVLTTLGIDDWRAYLRAIRVRAADRMATRPAWLRWLPLAVYVALVALAVWLAQLYPRLVSFESILATLVIIGAVIATFALRNRNAFTPDENGAHLGRTEFRFEPDHFEVRRAHSVGRVEWALLRDVTRTPNHVFLWIDRYTAYTVRIADLAPLGADEFVARLSSMTQPAAASAAPLTNSDPSPTPAPAPIPTYWPAMPSLKQELLELLRLESHRSTNPDHLWGRDFTIALLAAFGVCLWIALDRLNYSDEATFYWYGLPSFGVVLLAVLVLSWMLSRLSSPRLPLRRAMLLVCACAPVVVIATWLLPKSGPVVEWLIIAIAVGWVTQLLNKALRAFTGRYQLRAIMSSVVACVVMLFLGARYFLGPEVWYEPDEQSQPTPQEDAARDALLFEQGTRIDAEIARMPAGDAGHPSTWFVGFAGDGSQRVFAGEIATAARVAAEKFATRGRELRLVNDQRDLEKYPLASGPALKHALLSLGRHMNRDNDVLFLALSSHGSEDGWLTVTQEDLEYWSQLGAGELRAMLDESGIRWRVIVVSACYAGSFIDSLRDDHTIVITAAAADRTSFGCSDENEITEFGAAFYRDALPKAANLRAAFEAARTLVAEREKADNREASDPQAWFGPLMEAKLEGREEMVPGEESGESQRSLR
jgi:peptidase C13-like protein